MMRHRRIRRCVLLLVVFATTGLFPGCVRERPSSKPPIHLVPDMDSQAKYEPQEASKFFADGAAMRTPVAGTIARGQLRGNDAYFRGLSSDGTPIPRLPMEVDLPLLERGRERFNIYCSPCHSRVGDGRGIMVARGYIPPPTFHSERLRTIEDGHIFGVITNGIRNMPAYRYQIPVADRWAIVAYFRALQRSQNAALEDVPAERRGEVR